MKKLRIRIYNGVDMTKICSCQIRGGLRGFDGRTMAIDTFSNGTFPTIRTISGFVGVIMPKQHKVCRAIPAGTHGSTPHLLKTIIINKKNKKMETKKEKKSLIPLTLPKELEDLDFEIRKLTPRECFRIMDVDDADIDKIQATGLSKSAQYKLAGNSICVNVLYHLFRKMFIEKENESCQLNLFG